MPSASDSRYAIPGFISILVVLGVLAVGNQTFDPLRPSAKETIDYSESSFTRVEARLWQDPFAAVEAYDASEIGSTESNSHDLKTAVSFLKISLAELESRSRVDAEEVKNYHSLLLKCLDLTLSSTKQLTAEVVCEPNRLNAPVLARWARERRSPELFAEQVRSELKSKWTDKTKLLLLPVTLPVGDYADLIERRHRSRYAVVAALSQHGFLPSDSEHIRVLRDYRLHCELGDACVDQDIPYEYFSFNPLLAGEEKDADGWVALVMWLQDGSLNKVLRPAMEQLSVELNHALSPVSNAETHIAEAERAMPAAVTAKAAEAGTADDRSKTVSTYLLGPYASSRLPPEDYKYRPPGAGNDDTVTKDPNYVPAEDPGHIEVINWSATNRIDADDAWGIVNAVSTDSQLLEVLSTVVERRVRGRSPKVVPTCDKSRPFVIPDEKAKYDRTVLLISEGDTGYATYLNSCAKKMFSRMEYEVIELAYLRGIDGQYPGHSPKKPADDSVKNGDSKSVSASLLQSGYSETSAGTSQFDYLRRLAKRLGDQRQRVDAIGVLGSDPYDKALVLQAMRSEYPNAVYFTTDLYSLFLREDSANNYRNLLVAASHDLAPKEAGGGKLGRDWPPLRDSYQSALYEATSLAAAAAFKAAKKTPEASNPPRTPDAAATANNTVAKQSGVKHQPVARVFEVGRGRTFELTDQSPTASTTRSGASAWLAFWTVHLLALFYFCAVVVQQLTIWKTATQTDKEKPEGDAITALALRTAAAATCIAAVTVMLDWTLDLIGTALKQYLYASQFTPSSSEQTVALAVLLLACACSLTFISIRPPGLYKIAIKQDASSDEKDRVAAETKLRAVISLTIVACFSVGYFIVWWLPNLLSGQVRELWSISQGVSVWPPLGIAALIIILSFVIYYFIEARKLFLAQDLKKQFLADKINPESGDSYLLDELKSFYSSLVGDLEPTWRDHGKYTISVLLLLYAFSLIALVDNGGALLFAATFHGGTGTIDIAQLLIVIPVSLFSVSLFLVGREARKMLEAIRNQDTQRADIRIQKDYESLRSLSSGNAAMQELVDKGAWMDGPLTAHARIYFENSKKPKTLYRKERFSASIQNALADIELVEMITKQLQRLFYIPVIILVMFSIAALPLFDPWPVSKPVLLFGCLVTTALVLQAWRLDYAARSVQKNLISVLSARHASIEHMAASKEITAPVLDMLTYAIHSIKNEHEGAFLPLTSLPLVRIIILTVGALGLILSQAIFGIGYSL
ncbi:MAG: hypothetical protein AB8B57_11465 [Congregibacter sp.]